MSGDIELLELLARSLEDDPAFMAWALSRFRMHEELSSLDSLGDKLGISRANLARLALCRRIPSKAHDLVARVREVAEYTSIDAAVLAGMLRQVEFVEHWPVDEPSAENVVLFPGAFSTTPMLAAARDREEESGRPEPPSQEDKG